MAESEKELRIILLGKTGTGKSRTGNTILGLKPGEEKQFEFACKGVSVTQNCTDRINSIFGRKIRVIDTPGVFDPNDSITNFDIQEEVKKSIIFTSPGPHAIVLTVKMGRFTTEDVNTLKHYIRYFGVEILRYVVIVFTHYDSWAGDFGDKGLKVPSLDEYTNTIPQYLQSFLEYCDDRYIAFDNRSENSKQVKKFIAMVDTMIKKNDGTYYTNENYEIAAQTMTRFDDRIEIEKNLREKWFPILDHIRLYMHEIPADHPLYSLLGSSE